MSLIILCRAEQEGSLTYCEFEKVVRYVSSRISDSLSRRMREYHRSFTDRQRVRCCLNRTMREVHDHAQAVHLIDHGLKYFYLFIFYVNYLVTVAGKIYHGGNIFMITLILKGKK